MTETHANRLISASAVIENIKSTPVGVDLILLPTNERQARPLARLDPQQQVEAWTEAVATSLNHAPTAEIVENIVQKRLQTKTVKASKSQSKRPSNKASWLVMIKYDAAAGIVIGYKSGRRGPEKVQISIDDLRKAGVPIADDPQRR